MVNKIKKRVFIFTFTVEKNLFSQHEEKRH